MTFKPFLSIHLIWSSGRKDGYIVAVALGKEVTILRVESETTDSVSLLKIYIGISLLS